MDLPSVILELIGGFTGESKILRETCWMLYNAIKKPEHAKVNIDCQYNLLKFCRTIARENKILDNIEDMKFTISISFKIKINDVAKLGIIPHIKKLTIDGFYGNFYEYDAKYCYNKYNINGNDEKYISPFPKVNTLCLKRIQFDRFVASRISANNLELIECDTLYYAINYLPDNILTIRKIYLDNKNPDILSQLYRFKNLEHVSVIYMYSIFTYLNTIPHSVKFFDINAGDNSILGICNELIEYGVELHSVVSTNQIDIDDIRDGRNISAYILYHRDTKITVS